MLLKHKIDRHEAFHQLVTMGEDMIDSLTVCEIPETTHACLPDFLSAVKGWGYQNLRRPVNLML